MVAYIFFMSIALSIDALSIGISYRIRGIIIPMRTKVVVGTVTAILMLGAISIGNILNGLISENVANVIGAVVLILIGLAFIESSLYGSEESAYDFNHSRTIDLGEGIFMAVALSADSIASGIALAVSGESNFAIGICVGVMQFGFLVLSDIIVEHMGVIKILSPKLCGIFSGLLLIVIGILRMI